MSLDELLDKIRTHHKTNGVSSAVLAYKHPEQDAILVYAKYMSTSDSVLAMMYRIEKLFPTNIFNGTMLDFVSEHEFTASFSFMNDNHYELNDFYE